MIRSNLERSTQQVVSILTSKADYGQQLFSGSAVPSLFRCQEGVVGWCEGVMYLMSPGRPNDIGLQLGKVCYPCSR